MLERRIGYGWGEYPDNRALSLQKRHKAVESERHPIGYMVIGTAKERDARSANIHIIRLVTYRRPTPDDAVPGDPRLS